MGNDGYRYQLVAMETGQHISHITTTEPAHRIGHRVTLNEAEYTVRTWGAPPATPHRILYVTPA